ncbi:GntR family transcriptional regulator [Kocuria coralli]|uniref:GntR family transcriptional regulator n=1 Tax=Kocuria coralli TaxID=1461025 RepID=A0A5J5KZ24_9MICC|nr:GntR family transcriptional regulator [Kocuria coralli]KAA9394899.1 GntR family transcriptional regulator [Kocuria coralli]
MSDINLQPIEKPQGVRDRVTRALRAAIISGEMAPGEIYSAPSLGARLGVSPTPVREAMLDLAKEGLVERLLNRGFRVTEVDDHYLDEITELRQLIEPPVVRDVVQLIPAEDIPGLRAAAEKIVQRAVEHDLYGYTETDKDFHLALLRYAGNGRIVKLIEELRAQTRLVGLASLAERGELAGSAAQHIAIVDAIEARDSDLVYRLMVDHISQTRSTWAGNPSGQ